MLISSVSGGFSGSFSNCLGRQSKLKKSAITFSFIEQFSSGSYSGPTLYSAIILARLTDLKLDLGEEESSWR